MTDVVYPRSPGCNEIEAATVSMDVGRIKYYNPKSLATIRVRNNIVSYGFHVDIV
jgi:hypothetical protein